MPANRPSLFQQIIRLDRSRTRRLYLCLHLVYARLRVRRESRLRILSTGEILWDIVEGGEFLGGAPLNFSVTSQKLGSFVSLLTGVGDDELGRKALHR